MEEALQYLIQSNRKTTTPILQDNLNNFFRFKHACNGWLKFLDCFSTTDYSDFNTTTNVVILSSTIDQKIRKE
jgi:hypothetical protein